MGGGAIQDWAAALARLGLKGSADWDTVELRLEEGTRVDVEEEKVVGC